MSNFKDNLFKSPTFRLIGFSPDFLRDFSSVVDFTPVTDRFNTDETDESADYESLKSDWEAVGIDVRKSLDKYASESNRN